MINRILAPCVVDCRFEPQSGQTKDYETGIWCLSNVENKLTLNKNIGKYDIWMWSEDKATYYKINLKNINVSYVVL
jgi:hypothetical protein